MDERLIAEVTSLRHALHACPELSGQERVTRATLEGWLRTHTTLELHPCGGGFYAAHREGDGLPGIALRAEMDALPDGRGGACHRCGHEGHAAVLCGVGRWLEGRRIGRNVFLLFQPAEEVGLGAEPCCEIFERERVDAIYGAHNLPGFPFGEVYTRGGTFACGSLGLTLRLRGTPAHAAYPEDGRNPARAIGEMLSELPERETNGWEGLVMCTVIGARLGEPNFGSAASAGEVWLTLRAERNRDLSRLKEQVIARARALAERDGLTLETEETDVFPSTENDTRCAAGLREALRAKELAEPMRWSEDFGHYLLRRPGAYFGVGAGESWPALHTENYEFPDALIPVMLQAWQRLLESPGTGREGET